MSTRIVTFALCIAAPSLARATLIDIAFNGAGGTTYPSAQVSGAGVLGSAGDHWNNYADSFKTGASPTNGYAASTVYLNNGGVPSSTTGPAKGNGNSANTPFSYPTSDTNSTTITSTAGLIDSTGATIPGGSVVWTGGNSWNNGQAGSANFPNAKIIGGFLVSAYQASSGADTTTAYNTVTVNGLTPGGLYNVVAYAWSSYFTNRITDMYVNTRSDQVTFGQLAQAANGSGIGSNWTFPSSSGTYYNGDGSVNSSYTGSVYYEWTNMTANASGQIIVYYRGDKAAGGGEGDLNALQIQSVPEPSGIMLMAIAAPVLLGAASWRRIRSVAGR